MSGANASPIGRSHQDMIAKYQYPKVHNAMWPGLVGKGSPGAEPFIDLDTMLDLTAAAEVDGIRFDGVDLFLYEPHVSIDSTDDDLKRLADRVRKRGFVIGSLVAPVWPPTGGGSAMGSADERKNFLTQVRKSCAVGRKHRDIRSGQPPCQRLPSLGWRHVGPHRRRDRFDGRRLCGNRRWVV